MGFIFYTKVYLENILYLILEAFNSFNHNHKPDWFATTLYDLNIVWNTHKETTVLHVVAKYYFKFIINLRSSSF